MPKEETITLSGKVVECLPNATFKVLLENNHTVMCNISGRIRKFNINILLHDRVDIEMTPYDLERGRITFRHKS